MRLRPSTIFDNKINFDKYKRWIRADDKIHPGEMEMSHSKIDFDFNLIRLGHFCTPVVSMYAD